MQMLPFSHVGHRDVAFPIVDGTGASVSFPFTIAALGNATFRLQAIVPDAEMWLIYVGGTTYVPDDANLNIRTITADVIASGRRGGTSTYPVPFHLTDPNLGGQRVTLAVQLSGMQALEGDIVRFRWVIDNADAVNAHDITTMQGGVKVLPFRLVTSVSVPEFQVQRR